MRSWIEQGQKDKNGVGLKYSVIGVYVQNQSFYLGGWFYRRLHHNKQIAYVVHLLSFGLVNGRH